MGGQSIARDSLWRVSSQLSRHAQSGASLCWPKLNLLMRGLAYLRWYVFLGRVPSLSVSGPWQVVPWHTCAPHVRVGGFHHGTLLNWKWTWGLSRQGESIFRRHCHPM